MIDQRQNRLMEAVLSFTEQEVQYRINNPPGSRNDSQAINLKKQYYQDLLNHFKRKLNKPEKATRRFLQHELKKLTFSTNPTILNALLYGRLSRWVQNFLKGDLARIKREEQVVHRLQNQIGQRENLNLLNETIKQAGFTQDVTNILEKSIARGLPRFHIRYADIRKSNTDFVLHFSLIPGTGAYQFKKFDAASRLSISQQDGIQEQYWQSFSWSSEKSFSATEAAHLVNGRGICKNGIDWIILDKTDLRNPFKTVSFHLESSLKELPLQKMSAVEYKNIINTLSSGAVKEVPLKIGGQSLLYKIVANPQFQKIRILDEDNRLVDVNSFMEKMNQQQEKIARIIDKSENKVIAMDFQKKNTIR